ncbi:hypothetical protein E6C70_09720 [Glaciibacter flavus]|uniref:Uncharacterized protein n=1 Tax=Orlajensenia flava TaxID=2565934 RepID=A0A4S4FUW3_9MICO|nr:hypothetical protein [Glaciibacter flavus]THG34523.1 hypothetical protein E6C70_09720 [Glaciibacter flavus]
MSGTISVRRRVYIPYKSFSVDGIAPGREPGGVGQTDPWFGNVARTATGAVFGAGDVEMLADVTVESNGEAPQLVSNASWVAEASVQAKGGNLYVHGIDHDSDETCEDPYPEELDDINLAAGGAGSYRVRVSYWPADERNRKPSSYLIQTWEAPPADPNFRSAGSA